MRLYIHTSTLLLSALGVSSSCYTFWLSKEKNLQLICPGWPQLQKEDLQIDFSSSDTHDTLVNLLHNRGSRPAYLVVCGFTLL